MKIARKAVKKAYDDLNLKYTSTKKRIDMCITVSKEFDAVIQSAIITKDVLTFEVFYPENVEKQYIDDVCNDILDINLAISLGSFDIDRQDGQVRFRSAIALDGSELSPDVVKKHIFLGLSSMNFFQKNVWRKYHVPGGGGGPSNEEQVYEPRKDDGRFEPMFM